jgi:hypothetical protein
MQDLINESLILPLSGSSHFSPQSNVEEGAENDEVKVK